MPLKDVIKVNRKTFFNPSAWMGYGTLKSQFEQTRDIVKGIFSPERAARKESFEQAMARLNLTEKNLSDIKKRYTLIALFFSLLGMGLLGYGFYLVIEFGSFHGFLLALAVSCLALVNAFRFHFLAFQIRVRRLGCTFDEYFKQLIHFTGRGKHD